MNTRDERGITLVALVVMVILLVMLGIFSIGYGNNYFNTKIFQDRNAQSELNMLQQAVLERYTKYLITKDSSLLVGKKIDNTNDLPEDLIVISSISEDFDMAYGQNTYQIDKYYYIISNNVIDNIVEDNNNYFELLDIENVENFVDGNYKSANKAYIVNYFTGEVMEIETEIKNNKVELKRDQMSRYIIKHTSDEDLLYVYTK